MFRAFFESQGAAEIQNEQEKNIKRANRVVSDILVSDRLRQIPVGKMTCKPLISVGNKEIVSRISTYELVIYWHEFNYSNCLSRDVRGMAFFDHQYAYLVGTNTVRIVQHSARIVHCTAVGNHKEQYADAAIGHGNSLNVQDALRYRTAHVPSAVRHCLPA